MILETVLLWGHEVAAVVLRHLDGPFPGGGGDGGVDVEGDGDAGGTGGNVHVLASVVPTDDGRGSHAGHSD